MRNDRDARHSPQHIHRHRRHAIGDRWHDGERDAARRAIIMLVLAVAGLLLRCVAACTGQEGDLRGRGLAVMVVLVIDVVVMMFDVMMFDVAARRGVRCVVTAAMREMTVRVMIDDMMRRVPRPVQPRPRPCTADTGQHEGQQQKPSQCTASRRSRELPRHDVFL